MSWLHKELWSHLPFIRLTNLVISDTGWVGRAEREVMLETKKGRESRSARLTLPLIYFPLNFHHTFNNTCTCITINLRSRGRPIKRTGLSGSDSGVVRWGCTSIHHPTVSFTLMRKTITREITLAMRSGETRLHIPHTRRSLEVLERVTAKDWDCSQCAYDDLYWPRRHVRSAMARALRRHKVTERGERSFPWFVNQHIQDASKEMRFSSEKSYIFLEILLFKNDETGWFWQRGWNQAVILVLWNH